LPSPSETLLSIRLLDFKTSLLEATEELRIRRETETNYEDQINKIVIEKQELEWQKETLQHQTNTLQQQNKEAMAAFKKQLQARLFAMEEEKGKYQLAVETKEKEINGLKETLKALQISKYTLQKKLNEMDQKLQMHLTAKEEHHKKLNEIERCYATIASQFGIVKGVHGKLEHSVQEAIQHNKKLASVNKRQETEISNLKEELKKVTTDLIRSKVTSQHRVGEENINLAVKEKQFQELQQKIRMETAVSKKVQEENSHIKEEKLEILSSLQCVQELLQRITQTNVRMESELNALKEDYQALERDNELQREKAKENEEKFLNLQNEHEKALRTWKKDEENMRREIHTIKNELNSLKGLHRHLEDDHPPQGNQHSEQVENLQVSVVTSCKDSEIQAIQKENEFMQSVIRKHGNCGNEEETEVNTRDKSSSVEEFKIEQSNNLPWIIEISNLQVLENSYKDEINVASPCEVKQREASPRNTLCTDTDLITQGHTSEMQVTGCKEAEDPGTTQRLILDETNSNLDQKSQDSMEPLAAHHTQTRKAFLGSTETVCADRKNGSQETNTSKEELSNTTDESACARADTNSDTRQHNKNVLTPGAPKPESEAVLCMEKRALHERSTDSHQAKELSFGILPYTKENSQAEYQKRSLLNSDNYVGSGLHKTEKTLNLSALHRDKFPLEQTHIDAEGRNNDSARNMNSTGVLVTDAQNPPTVCCDDASGDDAAAKEHGDNKSLLGTFNLCPPKTERGINVHDMHSKQPEQDSAKQTGSPTNTWTSSAEAKSPVKADGLESAHKKPPTDRASTDKPIPCKNVNNDTQIHSIETGHSPEINTSTNNTLLKQKKDSLNTTVPGRKFAEGHLKESCSLPMGTSGNLVNISVRSSFDLSTSDKKAEKTPPYLNFLALSSCSRVNQMRGQATWASASKEPSLLKPCLVENTNIISNTQSQNLSENVDSGETEQGSSSLNRAANTLNTSSIHRDPQGDPSEEWNAIAKAFYDSSFPTEHVKEGFAALQSKKESSRKTVTPARSEKALKDEDSCSLHNSIIQNQLGGIEKLLNLEILHSARKRKYEE
ncbi:CCD73 protein, partial [Machaerirhynchus nigripectus]|nr:CCD73 protein [Machaerirhynchus nigripectus]